MKQICLTIITIAIVLMGCASSVPPVEGDKYVDEDSVFLVDNDLVNLSADTIIDSCGSMHAFYRALSDLQSTSASQGPRVVSIVHYGDSHIQGGFLSQTVMRRLAIRYGNAGRGLIIPHKLSGKNEPRDYSITASLANQSRVVIDRSGDLNLGVSGVAITPPCDASYTLKVFNTPDNKIDYRFSRVVAFHDSLAPIISARREELVYESSGDEFVSPYNTVVNLIKPTDELELTTSRDGIYGDGPIYGFSLENGKPGIIYHSIGVNGACYLHWGRYEQIARQSELLAPQLIIVSLGSNEASGSNFIESVFLQQVDSFVSKLRLANPDASILLTTPAQAMRRKVPNENFELVRQALVKYGVQNGVAVFDLYNATGGSGSASTWSKNGLLYRDGIHYTAQGYHLQGLLIYNALVGQWK